MADHGAPNAGAANDVGWDSAAASADGPDADAGPAHRPGAPRVPTAASLQSQASFHGMRQLLTSRARTVSSRADTAHVLERERLEVALAGASLDEDVLKTYNPKRGWLQRWLGLGKAHAQCVVKITDVAWGVRTRRSSSTSARSFMEIPKVYDFVRMPGMLEPSLLEVKLEVRKRNSLLGPSVVSRIGSVSFDLRDDDIGHDQLPQWHQLVTDEGVNAPGMVLLQIMKGKVGIEEIMAERRRMYMRILFWVCLFAAALAITFYFLLRPRYCDAKCRGAWRGEAAMSMPRTDLAAAVYKDKIFALGGRSLHAVESYSSKNGKWAAESSMAVARGRLGAATIGNILVAVGGVGRVSAEAFNGTAFASYSSLPALQGNVHAVTFRNESVCLVGRRGGYGVVPPSLGSNTEYTLDVRCMKGLNSTWDYKTKVPADRQSFAVATFSGRLLVIGGWLHGPSAVVEAYDGNAWERLPDLLTPRSAAAAGSSTSSEFCSVRPLVLIPVCVAIRGFKLADFMLGPMPQVIISSPFTFLDSPSPPSPPSFSYVVTAQMGNRLYVSGGTDGYSTLSSLESFDGAKWRAELPLMRSRQAHAALVYMGRLWILGGVSVSGSKVETLSSAESFILNVEGEYIGSIL